MFSSTAVQSAGSSAGSARVVKQKGFECKPISSDSYELQGKGEWRGGGDLVLASNCDYLVKFNTSLGQ
jgi:hypothetical protein